MTSQISRRKFLKMGSQGTIALTIVPYFFKHYEDKAFAKTKPVDKNLKDYFEHFG